MLMLVDYVLPSTFNDYHKPPFPFFEDTTKLISGNHLRDFHHFRKKIFPALKGLANKHSLNPTK